MTAMLDLKVNRYQLGLQFQTHAKQYLEQLGYRIVEENFKWKRGEIDLIFLENNCLVFVEVRAASVQNKWLKFSISAKKRQALVRNVPIYFFKRPQWRGYAFRFDFIWIQNLKIEHWKNVQLV